MRNTKHEEYILMIKGIYDVLKQTKDYSEMNIEKVKK